MLLKLSRSNLFLNVFIFLCVPLLPPEDRRFEKAMTDFKHFIGIRTD